MQKLRPALQYSEGRSKPWSGAKLVNAFAEMSEGDKVEVLSGVNDGERVVTEPQLAARIR